MRQPDGLGRTQDVIDAGASGLLLNEVRGDVAIGNFNFPQNGDLILIDGDTGTQL